MIELKAGQIWRHNEFSPVYEIIKVRNTTVVIENTEDLDIAVVLKHSFNNMQLVKDAPPSDLSIIQKALDDINEVLTMYVDGSCEISAYEGDELVFNTPEELLAWAKSVLKENNDEL